MKSYSKFQNYLSLLMFITINILFYFKYLSKISIACGAITSVLYILFIIFLFKYKPTFGRKLVNVGIITFIIATSSLLFFIPKEIFTADRWIIIDLFWDSVSNGLYPYAEKTSIGNYPGAMPFYFLLCYPFYCIREIGFITVISIALLAFHFKRKSVQSYSLFFILSISSLCIYWEIFSRSTILINAVLFTLFLLYLERFRTFSTRQLIWSCSLFATCSCCRSSYGDCINSFKKKHLRRKYSCGALFSYCPSRLLSFLSSGYIPMSFGRSIRSPHNHLWYLFTS